MGVNVNWHMSAAALLEAVEAVGRLLEGGAGLRFLLSRSYRARTLERWRGEKWPTIVLECVGAAIGLMVIGLLAYVVVLYLFIGEQT